MISPLRLHVWCLTVGFGPPGSECCQQGWALSLSPAWPLPVRDASLHSSLRLSSYTSRAGNGMHTQAEHSSCNVSAVCVWGTLMSGQSSFLRAHSPLSGSRSVFFLICFFCHPLSFPAPATSISLLSLSATHIHCVWSSVGQRSSTEPQDWLADSWKTEGRNCTGSQVLFKMCYWPQNVKGRNSQHTFLPKHELDVFSYPLKHFITHHQCSQLKTAHYILLFFK